MFTPLFIYLKKPDTFAMLHQISCNPAQNQPFNILFLDYRSVKAIKAIIKADNATAPE
jgi:hypothetical protein